MHRPHLPNQLCNDDFDSVTYLKLALATSCCDKKKMFPGVAHSLPTITFHPCSGLGCFFFFNFFLFFFLLHLFFCYVPFCRQKGHSVVTKNDRNVQCLLFPCDLQLESPPFKKKKKSRVEKGRRKNCVGS